MPVRVNLQQVRVSKRYHVTLQQGLTDLEGWAVVHHREGPFALQNEARQMNALLIDFCQSAFERHLPLSHGRRAILGVQHKFRHLKGELRAAWDSISSWEQLQPLKMRVPCPETIAESIFCVALLRGFWLEPALAHLWIPFGVLAWVAWKGLLRPIEAVSLRVSDVVLPSILHTALVDSVVLSIQNPKNRRSMGKHQVSHVLCTRCSCWLRWLTTGVHHDVKNFPGTTATFRRLFSQVCTELNVGHLGLSPASLRAGGATHLFLSGWETSRIRIFGRWEALESLDHYIQVAASALTLINATPCVLKELQAILSKKDNFVLPPLRGWEFFFERKAQIRAHLRWTARASLQRSAKQRL